MKGVWSTCERTLNMLKSVFLVLRNVGVNDMTTVGCWMIWYHRRRSVCSEVHQYDMQDMESGEIWSEEVRCSSKTKVACTVDSECCEWCVAYFAICFLIPMTTQNVVFEELRVKRVAVIQEDTYCSLLWVSQIWWMKGQEKLSSICIKVWIEQK